MTQEEKDYKEMKRIERIARALLAEIERKDGAA